MLPDHEHVEIEQTWVLEGHLVDKAGPDEGIECKAGQFIWRPAGSRHSAWSPKGGLMLAFFQIPNKFFEGDGRITDIRTRYTVIRALNGCEAIVPNEMLITQRVENLSLADRNVLISTVVQVAYGTDVEVLMPKLVAAAAARWRSERVRECPIFARMGMAIMVSVTSSMMLRLVGSVIRP